MLLINETFCYRIPSEVAYNTKYITKFGEGYFGEGYLLIAFLVRKDGTLSTYFSIMDNLNQKGQTKITKINKYLLFGFCMGKASLVQRTLMLLG